jgi:hypothetical protein
VPIQIDHARARELAPRFDEALELVRVEDDAPRTGMWSVTQPQWISIVRRTR